MGQDAKRDSYREAIDKALAGLLELALVVENRSHRITTELLGAEVTEARARQPSSRCRHPSVCRMAARGAAAHPGGQSHPRRRERQPGTH